MQAWLPAGFSNDQSSSSSPGLLSCFQEQIRLSIIIERILTALVSTEAVTDRTRWEGCISDVNLQLHRWKDKLPVQLRWNEWESSSNILNPSIAVLQ